MTGYDSKRKMAADKQEPWNEDEWRRNNWRCGHGWLRGEQCEICNAAQPAQEPPSEWEGIKAILDEYGLQAIDFVADFKAAVAQPAQEPVAHLWECLGRWSAYLVENGKQADCAPPSWLVEAINKATTSPLPAQEPDALTIAYQSGYYDGKKAALAGREWNFCERCGKRTADLTIIHTCTPPQGDA
jgi:hypothetical protein